MVVTHLYEMFLYSMLHKINSEVFMFLSYNEKWNRLIKYSSTILHDDNNMFSSKFK